MAERENDNFYALKTFIEKNVSAFLRDVVMCCCDNSVQTLKEIVRNYRRDNRNSISNKDFRTIDGLANNLKALKMDLLCKMFAAGICDTKFNNNIADWTITDHPPQGNDVCFLTDIKRLIWMWKKKIKPNEEEEELNENDSRFCWKLLNEISTRAAENNDPCISTSGRRLLQSVTQTEQQSTALGESFCLQNFLKFLKPGSCGIISQPSCYVFWYIKDIIFTYFGHITLLRLRITDEG
ncbi:hypothetical protein FSP39_013694 [Pinctada imbricata]|uniref:Uncharacterized protein n=1 Tax=Pinctada imbricata TaxID=66713 RepID=A0AA88XYW6_PINIB|nr:hypothetical protein FSP39_013694 [Pinctada imbricata]